MAAGTATDATAINFTRDYLKRFEAELPKAANAAALIATMQQAYPKAGMGLALAYKMVSLSGGQLQIDDGLDGGTCILFDLPLEND
jgi:sensor histidine kinase regulating citrate/malate metabolism